ncbi:MAG: hypothetical protein ACI9A8_000468, partial [Cryomorphaceae bacterium]
MALRLILERLNVEFDNRWFFSNIEKALDAQKVAVPKVGTATPNLQIEIFLSRDYQPFDFLETTGGHAHQINPVGHSVC